MSFARDAHAEEIGARKIAHFRSLLEANFDIIEGSYEAIDSLQYCLAQPPLLSDCQGNNFGEPYLGYRFDKVPKDQTVPNTGLYTFRLREDEALVFVGKTPPPMAYFGFTTYLFYRHTATPDPLNLYANLADTINNLTIQTRRPQKGPFDRPFMLITTADRRTQGLVRRAAAAAGFPPALINTDVIPSSIVHMGLSYDADEFQCLMRTAVPEDQDALDNYLKNPGGTLLRLTPRRRATPSPFPAPTLRVRGTGATEFDLLPDLEMLRLKLLKGNTGYYAQEFDFGVKSVDGIDYIQRDKFIRGPTRDTVYLTTGPSTTAGPGPFTLGPDDFLVVFGVDHAATGKASYSQLTVYQMQMALGFASQTIQLLSGSAEAYLPDNPNAKYLYAYKIARDCKGDPNCLDLSQAAADLNEKYGYTLDLTGDLQLVFRAYLETATGVGPYWYELLYDRAIQFTPTSAGP